MRLRAEQLGVQFGDFHALSQVDIEFRPGEVHAILGENGAGKSTLLKTLFGLQEPSSGQIWIDERKVRWRSPQEAIGRGLGMVQQHFTLVENMSVLDNIMLGAEVCSRWGVLDREAALRTLEAKLPSSALKLPWWNEVSTLSVGEKQRLEVLKLLFREAQILFLDEPTAVLSPLEIEEFFAILKKLKQSGRSVVLITHKIAEVMQVADTFTVLRQGQVIRQGKVSDTTAGELVESMIGRRLKPFSFPKLAAEGKALLKIEGLKSPGLNGISFHVRAGEIVGVAGVEGSGQGPLVNCLLGLNSFEGAIDLLGAPVHYRQTRETRARGVGLVPEDRHTQGLWLEESSLVNMILGIEEGFTRRGIFSRKTIADVTGLWAKQFQLSAPTLNTPVMKLSGGNQQKVIFAREVSGRKPRFMICHQPTRGVDLGAIEVIHSELMGLKEQGVGTLLLSSELDELFKLCDRIVVLFQGRITGEFPREQFSAEAVGRAMTGVANAH